MWVGCSTTKGDAHLSELFGFLPVRVLVQLVSARGQLGALRHDLGFLSHVPSQFCRFSIKTFLLLAGASFRCARGRYVRGGCIHGPYGSSRPCRVARLDGVKRRACDDCLVHAAVSHEELLLLSPWKHENKLLGSPAVGGIYTGKLDWKRRFAESSNNSVR